MSIDKRFIRHYVIIAALLAVAGSTLVRYARLAGGAGVGLPSSATTQPPGGNHGFVCRSTSNVTITAVECQR